MATQDPSFAALRRQIHEALRAQHPDWIRPDGRSPECDDYERRFEQTLSQVAAAQRHQNQVSTTGKIHVFSSRKSSLPENAHHRSAHAA